MKILWVKSDFLHPTTRGGQIRTLEILKRLHARHDVHYVAFNDPDEPEGLQRSREYCTRAHPVAHTVASRRSFGFFAQLVRGLWSKVPVPIARFQSATMRSTVQDLRRAERFDAVVCDFLTVSINVAEPRGVVLFQHNVESVIWERTAETSGNPAERAYLRLQANRMARFEGDMCRAVQHVIAVSEADASLMRERFNVSRVSTIPTGVDLEFFARSNAVEPAADLVFVGSMDWHPNVDGVQYFVREVLPLIRRERPHTTFAIVGRRPGPEISSLAKEISGVSVTGTVPDVRPYLWGSQVMVVPLRIGGGTRLKIFEAMAAGTPVVSTTIGAEGLDVSAPAQIQLADTPDAFAASCLRLLKSPEEALGMSRAALGVVSQRFSWDVVVRRFEDVLRDSGPSAVA